MTTRYINQLFTYLLTWSPKWT